MNGIADHIRDAILTNLWADGPVTNAARRGELRRDRRPRRRQSSATALHLCGTAEYVNLPAGIVSSLHDFTISVWVNPSVRTGHGRGSSTSAPARRATCSSRISGGGVGPRFAITTSGSGGEQQLTRPGQLPTQHLVAPRGDASRHDRHAVHQRHRRRDEHEHDARPGRPRDDEPELDRPLAVRRPAARRDRRRLPDLRPRPHRRRGRRARRAAAGRRQRRLATASTKPAGRRWSTRRATAGTRRSSPSRSRRSPAPASVFLQRHLPTDNLVCWKDQQNFTPFIDGDPAGHGPVHAGSPLLRRRGGVRDHADLHRRPGGLPGGPGVRAVRPRHEQLLEHQRDAPGAALLEGAARLPDRRTSRTACTAGSSSGCRGTRTSTATTASPTTTSSSSTGTRRPRPSAGRGSTTTSSARTTGWSSRTSRASGRGSTARSSCGRSTWATTTSRSTT